MSQRLRTTKSKYLSTNSVPAEQEEGPKTPTTAIPKPLSQALTTTANLANLLPTGTLLAFQMLVPACTNNGSCDSTSRLLAEILLAVLASSAFLACFTDSFVQDGNVYYGFATRRGMFVFDFPSDAKLPDLTAKRLRVVDFVHAALSVLVFGSVALRDKNVVSCLYPRPEGEMKEALDIVPVGVGLVCSLLFVVFPTTRHGIGYPVTNGNR